MKRVFCLGLLILAIFLLVGCDQVVTTTTTISTSTSIANSTSTTANSGSTTIDNTTSSSTTIDGNVTSTSTSTSTTVETTTTTTTTIEIIATTTTTTVATDPTVLVVPNGANLNTALSGLSSSITTIKLTAGGSYTLTGDLVVPNGIALFDGQGATINVNGKVIRMNDLTTASVELKNLTITGSLEGVNSSIYAGKQAIEISRDANPVKLTNIVTDGGISGVGSTTITLDTINFGTNSKAVNTLSGLTTLTLNNVVGTFQPGDLSGTSVTEANFFACYPIKNLVINSNSKQKISANFDSVNKNDFEGSVFRIDEFLANANVTVNGVDFTGVSLNTAKTNNKLNIFKFYQNDTVGFSFTGSDFAFTQVPQVASGNLAFVLGFRSGQDLGVDKKVVFDTCRFKYAGNTIGIARIEQFITQSKVEFKSCIFNIPPSEESFEINSSMWVTQVGATYTMEEALTTYGGCTSNGSNTQSNW